MGALNRQNSLYKLLISKKIILSNVQIIRKFEFAGTGYLDNFINQLNTLCL